MATGNFILNGSRKKVGSIVTYRRNGKQVIRAAAASVSNPRTVAQSRRRCFFAPAAKFYSPLATVLETSFQGKSKSQSYNAYLKKAIKDAAANGWYLPKGTGFFPLPYQLSQGTLQPVNYFMEEGALWLSLPDFEIDSITTIGHLSEYFMGLGYEEGMQVTFIFVASDTNLGDQPDYVSCNYYVESMYFVIAPNSTELVADVLPGLEIIRRGGHWNFWLSADYTAAGACIISKFENGVWRRSTQSLACDPWMMTDISHQRNVAASIASYGYASRDVESDIYLNQGEGDAASSVTLFALTNGSVVTPVSIEYRSNGAAVRCKRGTDTVLYASVSMGAGNYLLTASTKGAMPQGQSALPWLIDGNNADWKAWLQSQGVAASVFQ